jgi:tetratricopeptide (TPR) repeat protein
LPAGRVGWACEAVTALASAAQADRLAQGGHMAEAERAYRAALAVDRTFAPAALGLAHLLLWQRRPGDAAEVLAPVAVLPNAQAQALDLHVRALVGAGRPEDALPFSRRAAAAGVAHARLGSAQLAAELGRFAEAEADFRAVLAADPRDERARRGLARAVFAGPRGMDGALAIADEGLAYGWTPSLAMFKASLLTEAFRPAEAYAVLREALARGPASAELHAAAAGAAAMSHRPEGALAHAEAAGRLAPDHLEIAVLLAETCLCAGQAARAAAILEPLRRLTPFDPKLIALCATAMRLLGQEGYGALYDYERMVRTYTLEPPQGWSSLGGFLADLAGRLNALHDSRGATLDQSVRGGAQAKVHLAPAGDAVLEGLFAALEAPIAAYVAQLGRGGDPLGDPLRARSTGAFAIGGAWSVRLRPGEGRHVNHIHREGWLSSAFYVDLPAAMGEAAGEDGWIQFGEPNLPTVPSLPAEHKVRPQAGGLVLFPSYMWHGTLPFGGAEPRLTFAFDVIPIAK